MGLLPLDVLMRLPLAPVMLWMGTRVRRNALVLPEASGAREGTFGEGRDVRLLILGDSSGAGVGVVTQSAALSGQLVNALGLHCRVHWRLIAKTGATTQSAAQMLLDARSGPYDVAVLALGVNDAVRLLPLRLWRARQAKLRKILRERFGVRCICVTGVPPLEYFPALPRLLQWILGSHARRMDGVLQEDLRTDSGAEHVQIDMPFSRDAMAEDGYHPSADTYRLWGQAMAKRILDVNGSSD
ncbi:SGNH/GDSL hydrolase family protein [Planktotalea arctica]|uniref:SGNH/GDSL hydrolase family protein n=1 Tax=Planktotalea arctica TaxID=1481893 RepID=UPI00321936BE